jgi:hypothetical protein
MFATINYFSLENKAGAFGPIGMAPVAENSTNDAKFKGLNPADAGTR